MHAIRLLPAAMAAMAAMVLLFATIAADARAAAAGRGAAASRLVRDAVERGTLRDKVAALTMLGADAPLLTSPALVRLVSMVRRGERRYVRSARRRRVPSY